MADLDLSKAVEAAEREVPCLNGGGPRVLGVSVVDVPNRAETAVNVIAPHVLRAAADQLGKESHWDHSGVHRPRARADEMDRDRARALAEEIAGGER